MWAEPRLLSKVVHRTATVNEDGDFLMQRITDKPLTRPSAGLPSRYTEINTGQLRAMRMNFMGFTEQLLPRAALM